MYRYGEPLTASGFRFRLRQYADTAAKTVPIISKKRVTPRVVATIIMLFFLTIICDFFGLTGGFAVSQLGLHLDAHQYWSNAYQSLEFGDVIIGLIKPLLFGFLVATIGCYYGLTSRGGTQGVGRATTQAVVAASILILAVNYFTSQLLLYLLK